MATKLLTYNKNTIMKKILIAVMVLSFAALSACKKDKLATVSSTITAPVLYTPQADTTITVTPADSSQVFKVTWNKSDYGVSSVNSYFIEVDSAGKNFSKNIVLANLSSVNTLAFSISNGSLNDKLMAGLGLTANALSTIELRIGSAIYGADTVYSKSIKIAFTTYKALAPDKLWLPGSYEGYNPGAAPTIPHVTTFTFEGYAYFSAAGNFKFTSAPDYSHVNYGDAGNGKLTTDGNAGGIVYNSAGVYLLDADIQNLTYSASYISTFGIIGPATPQGWNASTPMAYNQTTGLWTITLDLVGGNPLKFRANDAWDINYGPLDSNALAGTLQFNNPGSITIVDSGNYTITLDMTKTTHPDYYYTIVKN
jgi:hypothetical protein